jgi:hypothetical protein
MYYQSNNFTTRARSMSQFFFILGSVWLVTFNGIPLLLHDVNTYSEFYYQLFEPLPATEDWEVTLHFKMSVPKNLNLNICYFLNSEIKHVDCEMKIKYDQWYIYRYFKDRLSLRHASSY